MVVRKGKHKVLILVLDNEDFRKGSQSYLL